MIVYSEGGSLTLGKRFGILAKAARDISDGLYPTSGVKIWTATPEALAKKVDVCFFVITDIEFHTVVGVLVYQEETAC